MENLARKHKVEGVRRKLGLTHGITIDCVDRGKDYYVKGVCFSLTTMHVSKLY